jgi:hypothetical protein
MADVPCVLLDQVDEESTKARCLSSPPRVIDDAPTVAR